MKITFEIDTDNAAFEDGKGFEIRQMICRISSLEYETTENLETSLRDFNGNTVGTLTIRP